MTGAGEASPSRAQRFHDLAPEQRRQVHWRLAELALTVWVRFASGHDPLRYTESVAGTRQTVSIHLPGEALQAARSGRDPAGLVVHYREPLVALQEGDLEFPEPVTYAYYALYNLFARYALDEAVPDWLIVNQALAALPEEEGAALLDQCLRAAEARAPSSER